MTIERVHLSAIVRINPEFGTGPRDVHIALDYVPGDDDALARALLAAHQAQIHAAALAEGLANPAAFM